MLRTLGLLVFAVCLCQQVQARADAVPDVSAATALVRPANVVVLDVRTPAEFAAGHIEGAVNVDVSGDDFRARVGELDRARTYLVHCTKNVEHGRTDQALAVMSELGFGALQNLVGGYVAWKAAGGEVITASH